TILKARFTQHQTLVSHSQYCSNQSESPDLMQFMQIKCSRRRLADYQQDICMATLALCIPIDAAS
ncbi:TPA: hypothetical protein ACRR1C_005353, partial [Klebsiella quasipneumoniae]